MRKVASNFMSVPGAFLGVMALLDTLRAHTTYIHFSTGGMSVIPETDLRYLSVSGTSASLFTKCFPDSAAKKSVRPLHPTPASIVERRWKQDRVVGKGTGQADMDDGPLRVA